ncbi:MAG: hypothetical protein HQL54_06580 [Magnetococcales bacterium]|nr:hypothetical protein [Magnetococcales bacterium]
MFNISNTTSSSAIFTTSGAGKRLKRYSGQEDMFRKMTRRTINRTRDHQRRQIVDQWNNFSK